MIMYDIVNMASTSTSTLEVLDSELTIAEGGGASSDITYLFAGVFLAIVLQLITSMVTEWLSVRRLKRDELNLAENSFTAFEADVSTLLERSARTETEIRTRYDEIWRSLPDGTKSRYRSNVIAIDRKYWELLRERGDKNISNALYMERKKKVFNF